MTSEVAENQVKAFGRPRKDGSEGVIYTRPLYQFLLHNLPHDMILHGRVDVPKLAEKIGVSKMTIYRWIEENRVSIGGAKELIQISGEVEGTLEEHRKGAITLATMAPFVLN